MIIYALYNHGKTFHECHDNYSTFIKLCDELKSINMTKLSTLPVEVRDHVKMLLSPKPELRPDAGQLVKVDRLVQPTRKASARLSRCRFSKMWVRRLSSTSTRYSKWIIFNVRCSTRVSRK